MFKVVHTCDADKLIFINKFIVLEMLTLHGSISVSRGLCQNFSNVPVERQFVVFMICFIETPNLFALLVLATLVDCGLKVSVPILVSNCFNHFAIGHALTRLWGLTHLIV